MTDLCWICSEPTVAHAPLAPLPFRRCTACGFVFRSDRTAAEVTDVYEDDARGLERAGFAVDAVETIPITPYLSPRARLGPRHVAGRLKAAVWLRSPATTHPSGHELLRALAHKPV